MTAPATPPPMRSPRSFLLPSHGENFGPLRLAEALANGVPALVTDSTPWSGLNKTGSGWCVPWAEFGPAIRSATSEDLGSLQRRGLAGREWVLREFSWGRSARILSDFYSSLRAGTPARAVR